MTTKTITWQETDGRGELIASNEDGSVWGRVPCDEPITAATDSHAVAAALGLDAIDHDADTVFAT